MRLREDDKTLVLRKQIPRDCQGIFTMRVTRKIPPKLSYLLGVPESTPWNIAMIAIIKYFVHHYVLEDSLCENTVVMERNKKSVVKACNPSAHLKLYVLDLDATTQENISSKNYCNEPNLQQIAARLFALHGKNLKTDQFSDYFGEHITHNYRRDVIVDSPPQPFFMTLSEAIYGSAQCTNELRLLLCQHFSKFRLGVAKNPDDASDQLSVYEALRYFAQKLCVIIVLLFRCTEDTELSHCCFVPTLKDDGIESSTLGTEILSLPLICLHMLGNSRQKLFFSCLSTNKKVLSKSTLTEKMIIQVDRNLPPEDSSFASRVGCANEGSFGGSLELVPEIWIAYQNRKQKSKIMWIKQQLTRIMRKSDLMQNGISRDKQLTENDNKLLRFLIQFVNNTKNLVALSSWDDNENGLHTRKCSNVKNQSPTISFIGLDYPSLCSFSLFVDIFRLIAMNMRVFPLTIFGSASHTSSEGGFNMESHHQTQLGRHWGGRCYVWCGTFPPLIIITLCITLIVLLSSADYTRIYRCCHSRSMVNEHCDLWENEQAPESVSRNLYRVCNDEEKYYSFQSHLESNQSQRELYDLRERLLQLTLLGGLHARSTNHGGSYFSNSSEFISKGPLHSNKRYLVLLFFTQIVGACYSIVFIACMYIIATLISAYLSTRNLVLTVNRHITLLKRGRISQQTEDDNRLKCFEVISRPLRVFLSLVQLALCITSVLLAVIQTNESWLRAHQEDAADNFYMVLKCSDLGGRDSFWRQLCMKSFLGQQSDTIIDNEFFFDIFFKIYLSPRHDELNQTNGRSREGTILFGLAIWLLVATVLTLVSAVIMAPLPPLAVEFLSCPKRHIELNHVIRRRKHNVSVEGGPFLELRTRAECCDEARRLNSQKVRAMILSRIRDCFPEQANISISEVNNERKVEAMPIMVSSEPSSSMSTFYHPSDHLPNGLSSHETLLLQQQMYADIFQQEQKEVLKPTKRDCSPVNLHIDIPCHNVLRGPSDDESAPDPIPQELSPAFQCKEIDFKIKKVSDRINNLRST